MSTNFLSLIFRTTNALLWGDGIGRNLTPVEVDTNFWQIQEAVNDLQNNPVLPKEIESISVDGDQMTFTLSDGVTHFGPFTLPTSAFHFTGDFQGGFAYKAFDLFIPSDGGLYMVLHDHTSDSSFASGAADTGGPRYRLIIPAQNLYDIGFFFPGKPGAGIADGMALFTYRFTRDVYLPADLLGSVGGLATPCTADCSYPILKNAVPVGAINIAAGEVDATFDLYDSVQFNAGDRLRVMAPDALDTTAADLSVTFMANKGIAS